MTTQVLIALCTLAALFAGPFVAFAFMRIRKRKALAARRSPISRTLLRGPGETLREQIDELRMDVALEVGLLMAITPAAVSFYFMQRVYGAEVDPVFSLVLAASLVLFFLARGVVVLLRIGARLDKLRTGYDGELAVGQELNHLMRRGAAVFHDVPAENFNIDHVVIATTGIYAVETKGYTKPNRNAGREDARVVCDGRQLKFPTWTTSKPLEQAERQAAWLRHWLGGAVGEPVAVTPVLALPG